MASEVWSFPTRILFGAGSIETLGREAKRLGARHALVVTDPGVKAAGIGDTVGKQLKEAEIAYSLFDEVSSNPLEEQVQKAADSFKAASADIVIGVGGGSALDVAKLVRVLASHDRPLREFDASTGGSDKIGTSIPPMIAVPTTAGTGSEVGRAAVVTLTDNRKVVVFSPSLMPNVAILDPELTLSLPASVTASTGFDALTHCIEAYCSKGDHPMADAIALHGIELIANHLKTAVTKGDEPASRAAMLKAAMMGAVAFQKGLGACHALAHALSAKYNTHHGLANAVCLPAVIDFNRQAIPAKIARIARVLGARGDDEETLAFECSGAVRALRNEIGLVSGLAELNVEESALEELSAAAFEDPCHKENPRACTQEDLQALYKASL